MLRIPLFIARPIFEIVHLLIVRKSAGPVIRRKVEIPSPEKRQAFDALLDQALANAPNSLIEYDLPDPKAEFLAYVCDWRGLVAHGTPRTDLETLEPIRLTSDRSEFGNRQQVFCSPDGLWALWFAILDKSQVWLTENGCLRLGSGEHRTKYYHFRLPRELQSEPPFTDGMIYFARPGDFPDHLIIPPLERLDAEVEEWGSITEVVPLARVAVSPADFPYLDRVEFILERKDRSGKK